MYVHASSSGQTVESNEMFQERAGSTPLYHGAGEREIGRTSRRIKGQRMRRYGPPLLWLAYRRLDSTQRQAMMGVEALPLSKGGAVAASMAGTRRRPRRQEVEVNDLVLQNMLRQAVTWPAPLRLMIAQDEFTVPDGLFLERLERALDQTGFPSWRLDIPFSQSVFYEGGERYWMNLAALRDGGVRVFMRDFLEPPSSISFLEEAYRASVLDGVQFKASSFLAEEEGNALDNELFRQHLLQAVRALGVTVQICGVPASQERLLGNYMRIDSASINADMKKAWGICEVIAPVSEALSQIPL